MPSRIVVFDVNETLLDVNALEPHFARAFGSGSVCREWFATALLYSEVATLEVIVVFVPRSAVI